MALNTILYAINYCSICVKHTHTHTEIFSKFKLKNWKSVCCFTLVWKNILNVEGYFVHVHHHHLHRMEPQTHGGWIFFSLSRFLLLSPSKPLPFEMMYKMCGHVIHTDMYTFFCCSYPSRTNFQSTKLNYYNEWTAPTNFFIFFFLAY